MSALASNRFELVRKLGEGGMGVVYEAHDRVRSMSVALKVLRRRDAGNLYYLKREFRVLTDIAHPNIVNFYDLVAEGDQVVLSMELIKGESFLDYVRAGRRLPERGEGGGPPHVDELVDVARLRSCLAQLAQAVATLHEHGLVHRDIKPSNILVTAAGHLVLMDFGIVAELFRPIQMHLTSSSGGTPGYMAPEQVGGRAPTPAVDWYGVGVLVYQALAGRMPFLGSASAVLQAKQLYDPEPVDSLVRGAPPELVALCMALLRREPEARPDDLAVLASLGASVAGPMTQRLRSLFVGRAAELAILAEGYQAAESGRSDFVVLEGRSGMGKTRLVEHFLSGIARQSREAPLVCMSRCHERESLPLKALDGVIDDLSSYIDELPTEDRYAYMLPDMAYVCRLFPSFARIPEYRLLRVSVQLPPLVQRDLAVAGLRALIALLGERRPLLFVLEDLQWADADSIDVLRQILREPLPRLLVVATLSSESTAQPECAPVIEYIADQAAKGLCRRIQLGPLSVDEQQQFVASLSTSSHGMDASVAMHAGGHPLLLAELLRHEHEVLKPADEAAGSAAGMPLLTRVLRRRIARLPEPARDFLEMLAVAGEPLPLPVIADAVGLSSHDRERAALALRAAHLIRVVRSAEIPWVGIHHDAIHAAVVDAHEGEARAAMHAKLAAALERWRDAPAATVGRHWAAACQPLQAAPQLMRAAESAMSQYAFERSAALYRSLLATVPEGTGDAELARWRCRAQMGLAEGMRVIDDNDEALAHLDGAQREAEAHGMVAELAKVHYWRGSLLYSRRDVSGCLAQHTLARSYAEAAGEPLWQARALSGLGDAHLLGARVRSAYVHYRACLELAEQHRLVTVEVSNLPMYGWMNLYNGNPAAAIADGERSVAAALAVGDKRAEWVGRCGPFSHGLAEQGEWAQSYEGFARAVELAKELSSPRFQVVAITGMAQAKLLMGDRSRALELVREAIAMMRATSFAYSGAATLAMLALCTEDREEQQRAIAQGRAWVEAGTGSYNALFFYRYAMDACLQAGDFDLAETLAGSLAHYASAEPFAWAEFYCERTRALCAHGRGRRDADAREALRRAAEHGRAMGFLHGVGALDAALAEYPA